MEEPTRFGTCVDCGGVIPADRERCSLCGEPGSAPPPPLLDADEHPGAGHPYRPIGTLAISLRMLFTAWITLEGFVLGLNFSLYLIAGRLLDNPLAVSMEDYDSRLQLAKTIWLIEILVIVSIGLMFIAWMFRAYKNLLALGVTNRRFAQWWTIGGWVIPIWGLFRPKQIVDEIWRGSSPEQAYDQERSRIHTTSFGEMYPSTGWVAEPTVPTPVHLWWAAFLIGRTIIAVAGSAFDQDDGDLAGVQTGIIWLIIGILIQIAGAGLAIWLVSKVAERQAGRAALMGRTTPDRRATRFLTPHLAAIPLLVLALSIVGHQVFDASSASRVIDEIGADGLKRYEGFGITLTFDPEYRAAVGSLFSSEPSDFEGVIGLEGPDPTIFMAVSWFFDPGGLGRDAYVEMVDAGIDSAAAGSGTAPLIEVSPVIELPGGPSIFFGREFSFVADGDGISGVVAVGSCTITGKAIMVMSIHSGLGSESTARENVLELLAGLDC